MQFCTPSAGYPLMAQMRPEALVAMESPPSASACSSLVPDTTDTPCVAVTGGATDDGGDDGFP